MKKIVLALGSALMLLATTTVQAEETMSFGVKGGGSFFMPTVSEDGSKTFEGKTNMFIGGGLYFDYMVLDNLSVGAELAYSRKGYCMTLKNAKSDDEKKKRKGMHIHALDIAVPFTFFPMGKEEGLSLFAGPKGYLALSEKEVLNKGEEKSKDDSNDKDTPKIMRPFNVGVTVGAKYEIAETGFFVGANYEFFFLDSFNSDNKKKEARVGTPNKDKTFYTHGAQAFVGFDFARLF